MKSNKNLYQDTWIAIHSSATKAIFDIESDRVQCCYTSFSTQVTFVAHFADLGQPSRVWQGTFTIGNDVCDA